MTGLGETVSVVVVAAGATWITLATARSAAPPKSLTCTWTGVATAAPKVFEPTTSNPPCALAGTKNLPRLRLPWKYSMLEVLATWLLMKIAPKPRVPARAGLVPVALGRTNDWSIVLSLNIANVLFGLKALNNVVDAFGLTS